MMVMLDWATKRRAIYLIAIFGTIFIIISFFIFSSLQTEPSCFDGIQNQGELGIDCGGPCALRCDFQTTDPSVVWTRYFEVSPGFYSIAAYIRNPNLESYNPEIPYLFEVYNHVGEVVAERSGVAFINAGETFVIFEPNIDLPSGSVDRATFRFTEETPWYLDTEEEINLFVSGRQVSRLDTRPRVEALIENRSIFNILDLEATAVVYDGDGNAVGVSRTRTFRELPSRATERVVFTWPRPFDIPDEICTVPVDIMTVVDRSGSMVFDNFDLENPEPMTSAREAASSFIDNLNPDSLVGLVSFATSASLDFSLTDSSSGIKQAIESVNVRVADIEDIWTEHTNIFHGLELAFNELEENSRAEAEKFIILFTDGVPTHPQDDNNPDYAADSAREIAETIKNRGIELYAIGLGEEQIDQEFLLEIASGEDHFFSSADVEDLVGFYQEVATDLCRNDPSVVEIIPRVIGN